MVNLEIVRPSVGAIENLYQPSVLQLAQAGHFRAIAYWINTYLVPQGIYVCVSAASRPGYLLILVEFQQAPERERLIRFICHRLCKLKSDVILGAQIVACAPGSSQILWQRSIRLTPSSRRSGSHSRSRPVAVRRVKSTQPKIDWVKTAQALRERVSQLNIREQLNHPRSHLLAKSAAAAFVLGCGVEAINSTVQPAPMASIGGGDRPAIVETALGQVAVRQHEADLSSPTVTLSFSGEGALGATRPSSQTSTGASQRQPIQTDVTLAYLDTSVITRDTTPGNGTARNTAIASEVEALQADGVDVVNLAPASSEYDASAIAQTLETLEQAGIRPVGTGRNSREARRPEIMDVKGQRIAYLGYSDSDQGASSWNAGTPSGLSESGLSEQVGTDIQAIRDQVDWVVVNYHWSQELTEQPAEWQVNLAHTAIDQGADLVVGHHPSVLQGAEIYQGRAIAYSLGNFIFPDSKTSAVQTDYDTAMLKVSLRPEQMRLEFLPVQVRHDQPQLVTGEKAEEILQRIRKASTQFEQPMEFPITLDAQSTPLEAQPSSTQSDSTEPSSTPPSSTPPQAATTQPQTQFPETQPPETQIPETQIPETQPPSASQTNLLAPAPVEATPSTPSSEGDDSFITYPGGVEETPIENLTVPQPAQSEPFKEQSELLKEGADFNSDRSPQPVDAIPETEEVDVLPEAETEEITFPDEVAPLDPEIELLPGEGF